MEIDDENNGQELDSSPGALVWVRRRNGSWWPGRVLGPEELSESCLSPPRSGTPIKLLGREDGSVDWYNLEKSKRVKEFRCGEYDVCIEKARVHGLNCSKKPANTGKYVRREDAILHALELEEINQYDRIQKSGSGNYSLTLKREKPFLSQSKTGSVARNTSKHKKSSQNLSKSGISYEHPGNPIGDDTRYPQKKRWKPLNDSEDDATRGTKRMRDLQDLGLGMTSKRRPRDYLDFVFPDSASPSESDFDNDISGDAPMNSSKDSCPALKQKRLHVLQSCESLKKKCRRRSLAEVGATKVKKPTPRHRDAISAESSLHAVRNNKLSIGKSKLKKQDSPSVNDDGADCSGTSSEEALLNTHANSGKAASKGTDSHSRMNTNTFSNILEFLQYDTSVGFVNSPIMDGKDAADVPSMELNSSTKEIEADHQYVQVGLASQSNERLAEACSTGSSTQANNIKPIIDVGTSEWHTKGKRNARHLSVTKRVDSEITIDRNVNSAWDESLTSETSYQQIKYVSVSEVCDVIGNQNLNTSLGNVGKQNVNLDAGVVDPAESIKACDSQPHSSDVPNSAVSTHISLPPRQIRLPPRFRDSDEDTSHLYDVELDVQSNYQGARVPLVSLRSKFNGKAIVGHPVTVEIVGSDQFPDNNRNSIRKLLKERSETSSRSQAKGKHGVSKEKTRSVLLSKSSWSNKKPTSGKKSGFSPRKIRRLSSFADEHKGKEDRRKLVEKIMSPTVACIPLRLVFSRLNEALSGSARAAS